MHIVLLTSLVLTHFHTIQKPAEPKTVKSSQESHFHRKMVKKKTQPTSFQLKSPHMIEYLQQQSCPKQAAAYDAQTAEFPLKTEKVM